MSDFKKGGSLDESWKIAIKRNACRKQKNFRTLDTEASGLVILIRALLNPYEDIKNLDMDKVFVSVKRLKEITEEMQTLNEKIKKLESEFEQ